MDSKVVNKQIRAIIRPYLKSEGFTRFTSRSAWRYRPNIIDVVNFQSFNSYLAGSLGCTTYSFALNLGCYFPDIPSHYPNQIRIKDGDLVPEEYHCHFRLSLRKSLPQRGFPRDDIWYVDPEGRYLNAVIEDAKNVLKNDAKKWFERYQSLNEVLVELRFGKLKEWDTWGCGANPSPSRHYYTGFIAFVLNKPDLARIHLQAALDSGWFERVEPSIIGALDRLSK
jgi:hypothetical protein